MSEQKHDAANRSGSFSGRPHSLRRHLLILIGGMLVVTLLAIGVSVAYFIFQNEQHVWQERQGEAARRAAEIVEAFIRRTQDALVLVSFIERDNLVAEPRVMKDLLAQNLDLLEMIRTDKKGTVFASAYQDAPLLANLFTLPQAMWFMESQHGRSYRSEVETSADSQPYLIISVPASDGGVVAARLRLTVLQGLMTGLHFGETGQAYMVNRNGTIIGHPKPEVPLAYTSLAGRPEMIALLQAPNQQWSGAYVNFEGDKVVSATAPVMGTDWIVITEMIEAEAFAVSRIALFLFGGGLTLFGVLMLLIISRFLEQLVLQPMAQLRAGAVSFGQGNLSHRITVGRRDEIGQVAETFNQMATELQNLYHSLEKQVANRTRRLEIVGVMAERLNTILDLDQLLPEVVNQIKESFGYYHAQVYLVDQTGEKLVLAAGAGQAGAALKAKGHHIALDARASLVARASRTGEIVNVSNVRQTVDWLPNPLWPDTFAEMAVPIILEGQVVGVLDVQEDKIAGLDEGDASLLRSLANHLAVAINNARLFQKAQTALAEIELLNRRLTREAWQNIGQKVETTSYVFTKAFPALNSPEWLPPMSEAVQRKDLVHNSGSSNGHGNQDPVTSAAVPLTLRGEVIGVIGIERSIGKRWSEDELTALKVIGEQVALALDSARLARETERSAWRDQVVSETTARVWSSDEIEEVMRATVAQLGDKLRASEVVIRLGTEAELAQTLLA
jgi:GAF domain-containing protein/HAMP domain-containing protein